jgi:hypothetical protein
VTTNKNKELLRVIGRRLREAPELDAAQPLPRDIELHLERLRRLEKQGDARQDEPDEDAAQERGMGQFWATTE